MFLIFVFVRFVFAMFVSDSSISLMDMVHLATRNFVYKQKL